MRKLQILDYLYENFTTFSNQSNVCKISENREIKSGLSQLIGVIIKKKLQKKKEEKKKNLHF